MGLFTQRPEFNDELPGLPGEPARPETAAERLADAASVDIGMAGLLGEGAAAVESIVIPVSPYVEIAESQESGEDD
jgi:hypothetical protein